MQCCTQIGGGGSPGIKYVCSNSYYD